MSRLVDELLDVMGETSPGWELTGVAGVVVKEQSGGDFGRRYAMSLALMRAVLRKLARGLDGLPWILLKGPPLEELLYGGRFLRMTGDLDLLVLPGDLEDVRGRLETMGFESISAEGPRMWTHNQHAFRQSEYGVVVEVHWSLAESRSPQPAPHELFDSRVEFELSPGFAVEVLRLDWLFIHLVLHFHHHMGFAKGLLDVAGWLDHYAGEFDEVELLARARRLGMFGMVQWPLHTIAHLTGEEPPLWAPADLAVRAWAEATARALRGCLAAPPKGDLRRTLVEVMPAVGPVRGVPLQALSMLVADGGLSSKTRAALRPLLEGPHFLGRAMWRWGVIR